MVETLLTRIYRKRIWDLRIPYHQLDGLVQERRNSIANALELRLFCTDPSNCDILHPTSGTRKQQELLFLDCEDSGYSCGTWSRATQQDVYFKNTPERQDQHLMKPSWFFRRSIYDKFRLHMLKYSDGIPIKGLLVWIFILHRYKRLYESVQCRFILFW